jgi:amidophosphoribosyltransferase
MAGEARDACGVVGIYAPGEDVARLTYYGLYALQHRGQESAGIAISNGQTMLVYKELGLVSQVFDESVLKSLRGHLSIGHCRYSTTGSSSWENAQPSYKSSRVGGQIAVAHNGNLVNSVELKETLAEAGGDPTPEGARLPSSSDTDLVAAHIARASGGDARVAMREVLPKLSGAFSFAIMDETHVYGARDPQGFRPLCLGRLGEKGWIIASETCALDLLGAQFIRDVEPGELITIGPDGVESEMFAAAKPSACVFEHIYFARPDSTLMGQNVYATRYRMGQQLAKESPVTAELVMPVPDSGVPAAQGFAEASGIAYGEGFVKNRYVGRTFIQPDQRLRDQGIKLKFNPLAEVRGRRIVVVDDSIVRGSTTRQIVAMLYEAGALEVHVRVSSPPIVSPCFYGIDFADPDQLIASDRDVEAVRELIGATSLAYLSLDGLQAATRRPAASFCRACLTREYPTPVPLERRLDKRRFEATARAPGSPSPLRG